VPLLLPVVGYAIWLHFARRKAAQLATGALPAWQNAPWTWLVVSGVLLATLSVVGLGLLGGTPPGAGTYVPPRYVDGEIVPGHTE
jgi:hypothetical protein